MKNPYLNKSKKSYWRTAIAESSPFEIPEIYQAKWKISPQWNIATAGSCFAQHIHKNLRKRNFNVMEMEPAPILLPTDLHQKFGYSLYSARYGNIYTVEQLLQISKECTGLFVPQDISWERDGKYYDALRPSVEPEGFFSKDELLIHRKHHLRQVRKMFEETDLLIFTLGLTEGWIHKESRTVYPIAPGAMAGEFNEEIYEFKNFTYTEIVNSFIEFLSILIELRPGKELPKIILTVSPVPLTATGTDEHILKANTYSKSVLRSVAGFLASTYDFIDYFPSYEIVTNPLARGMFYEANLRSVRAQGVALVMKTFFDEHDGQTYIAPLELKHGHPLNVSDSSNVYCDESNLDTFSK